MSIWCARDWHPSSTPRWGKPRTAVGRWVVMISSPTWKSAPPAGLRAPRVNAAFLGAATSGSGDRIRREAEVRLALPILDSVPPPGTLHRAAENMRTEFFLSFYGDRDTSFDEASVRRIFDLAAVPGGQKVFSVLGGSDHAFRTVNGAPSFRPLIGMADSVVSFSARAIRERSR